MRCLWGRVSEVYKGGEVRCISGVGGLKVLSGQILSLYFIC